jgi:hypothetical protein
MKGDAHLTTVLVRAHGGYHQHCEHGDDECCCEYYYGPVHVLIRGAEGDRGSKEIPHPPEFHITLLD